MYTIPTAIQSRSNPYNLSGQRDSTSEDEETKENRGPREVISEDERAAEGEIQEERKEGKDTPKT
jgi:hypothetical protein